MTEIYRLQGTVRTAVRSDAEMKQIDKAAADLAFKKQKKRLDAFLKEKGFVKYKTNSYLHRNRIDVLEYIDLQKEQYGSKTATVNYALIPLYVPHRFLSFALGGRLGKLVCDRDVWWDYADDTIAALSFDSIMQAIDQILLPWFAEMASEKSIRQELIKEEIKRKRYGGRLSDIQQLWLDALDQHMDSGETISENMEVLKLPAGIR
ncbi:MAG: DUF4304 domain-containing protein [Solobacterium sp.]|nr:DUF4304 domain-containing protein [Solobacterium sp.]